ncbi:MAG: MFS transporter [Marmoricola sp.]
MLVLSNLLGGVGVASGVAVGGLLVQDLGATSLAGLGQGLSVLGAAVIAVPLARLADQRGRRWSLGIGYAIALVGAAMIVSAAVMHALPLLLLGLGCFGAASATNLQSRYAAVDGVDARSRGRTMSVVIWATTVGSVAGPNLTALGQQLGEQIGVPGLGGPYLFSLAAFALAFVVVTTAYRDPASVVATREERRLPPAPAADGPALAHGSLAALRWASARPIPRLAVTVVVIAHATMVMVMVMTPVHMKHEGTTLGIIGLVLSVHIAGMYALSPVFGWLVDRWGATRTIALGLGMLAASVMLGFFTAAVGGSEALIAAALWLLGLGWSACTIAGSSLIAATTDDRVRVPLQGATDALMNYGGAAAAVVAGPLLALGDFRAVNLAGALLLVPALVLWLGSERKVRTFAP